MGEESWDMVFMEGYLKKCGKKRNRRRYYVLHHHSSEWKTRLDCFDNAKKWKSGLPPRKTVHLSDLFNVAAINSKRFPCSFALYTNQEKLCLTADTEREQMRWIDIIEFNRDQEGTKKPVKEENIWQVTLKTKQESETDECVFQACISSQKIDFIDSSDDIAYSIPMDAIIKYGYTEASCYLEVNGSASLGDVSLIDGSSVIWLELIGDIEAEEFCNNITKFKKTRPRSNTEKRPSLRPGDFKRSLSQSDMLDVIADDRHSSTSSMYFNPTSLYDFLPTRESSNQSDNNRNTDSCYDWDSEHNKPVSGADPDNRSYSSVGFKPTSLYDFLPTRDSSNQSDNNNNNTDSCYDWDSENSKPVSGADFDHRPYSGDQDHKELMSQFSQHSEDVFAGIDHKELMSISPFTRHSEDIFGRDNDDEEVNRTFEIDYSIQHPLSTSLYCKS